MIKSIGNYEIYRKTFEEYKGKKAYQLANGKPNIRMIKKEAVDKLIAEVIINDGQSEVGFPELRTDASMSMIKNWWLSIKSMIKSLYSKSDIDIFNANFNIIQLGE